MHRSALAFLIALVIAPAAHAALVPYPASQTIFPSGPLPAAKATGVRLNAARGETEDAQIVVTRATTISARIDAQPLAPMQVRLLWAHYVRFGSRLVPDALQPWSGAARAAEEQNQPVWLQVDVPPETAAGTYETTISFDVDGRTTELPLTVRVFHAALPPFRARSGNLQTAFLVNPQLYLKKVSDLYGFSTLEERMATNESLFRFLAEHRISPASYGYGEPNSPQGYTRDARWWRDSAGNMEGQLTAAGGAFPVMRIPISSNRASPANYVGGLSPYRPESWCGYLGAVQSFWRQRGWAGSTTPYLYALDEPGNSADALVARQAAVAHRCFPGARSILTGSPNTSNRRLWDGRNGDDVDIWVPLARRYYGTFSSRSQSHRERSWFRSIAAARAHGKTIWSYTYTAVPGSPGFTATEPLSNSRLFLLWNALERTTGVLYGDGVTTYDGGNPYGAVGKHGEAVLLYPGVRAPIASARLEQIRDGIEDWALYDLVRRRFGSSRVRAILGGRGLFSASARGVQLACTQRCELQGTTKYAWPRWSRDATTPARIERAKLNALRLASR